MDPNIQRAILLFAILVISNLVIFGILFPKLTKYAKWVANTAFLILFSSGLFWFTPSLLGVALCIYFIGFALDRLQTERSQRAYSRDRSLIPGTPRG